MAKLVLYTASNCPNCPKAKAVVAEVAKELNWKEGVDYESKNIEDGDNLVEALMHQIASTPSILINNEPVFRGSEEIPTKEQLLEKLK
ncbi:MAG: thioredoxin family protein [archaeon]